MARLKIEKTVAWQVEGPGESYCCTTYSKPDALLCRDLAEGIPGLKCLREGARGKQPRGIYLYKTLEGKRYPLVEVYDRRLAARVRANMARIKGD